MYVFDYGMVGNQGALSPSWSGIDLHTIPIIFETLNLDLKNWLFLGNYLSEKSKTQSRILFVIGSFFSKKKAPLSGGAFLNLLPMKLQLLVWMGSMRSLLHLLPRELI